ncbi:branched-chain amino acid ABC transporter permease [Candidatus Peregrinibacteria bacterium]|nr:branched-chain amino acid ABC transporter permease [Candidatus Peregrinibacteria bacterium]
MLPSMTTAIFAKFVLNGIIAGSLYAILALGLSLLYGVLRFVNLAHGEIAIVGAYAFYSFYGILGWPLFPSFIAGIICLLAIVFLLEKFTFLPVRDSPPFIALIISIGVGIFLQNTLLLVFEPFARSLRAENTSYPLFSEIVRITDVQAITIFASLGLMIALWLFLQKTRLGKAIRAVADHKETASILGIPIQRIITLTFLISAFLAGTAGILAAFDQNLHPNLGSFFTIKSFAAVILGGIGSIPGAIAGGYFIGLAENILIAIPFAGTYIPSSYKDAVAFAALVLFLYFKPTGFFGARREEAVRK